MLSSHRRHEARELRRRSAAIPVGWTESAEALAVTPAKMLLFAAAVSIYCVAAVAIVSATDALAFSMAAAVGVVYFRAAIIITSLVASAHESTTGMPAPCASAYTVWPSLVATRN